LTSKQFGADLVDPLLPGVEISGAALAAQLGRDALG
jgi:hypothetical protein